MLAYFQVNLGHLRWRQTKGVDRSSRRPPREGRSGGNRVASADEGATRGHGQSSVREADGSRGVPQNGPGPGVQGVDVAVGAAGQHQQHPVGHAHGAEGERLLGSRRAPLYLASGIFKNMSGWPWCSHEGLSTCRRPGRPGNPSGA